MTEFTGSNIKGFFLSNSLKLKIDIRQELEKEILETNKKRIFALSIVLLILNVMLIFIDITVYRGFWKAIPQYVNLFYSHIAMTVFFLLTLVCTTSKLLKSNRVKSIYYQLFLIIALLWCSYLAINAQGIHTQISAFIIGCFCTASTFILTSKQSILILLTPTAYTIVGLLIVQHDFRDLTGNLINLIFTIFLAVVISRLNYKHYINEFLNRKTITKQNQQLEDIKENLEKTVNGRTKELSKANELLMEEVNMRHEAEAESQKNKLKFEETSEKLNKTFEYEQYRSNFFANLSHELRTPVNVIYSALQMLELLVNAEKAEESKPKINKYMKIIKQNCFRLIRLVGNLIDITKAEASYYNINLQNCDIVKLVENIALSVADYIESKRVYLIFDTDVEEKIISCDPDKIERIILNLLSNAVKFTESGGFIYVSISEKNEKICISVQDTGIGIPKERQSTIFERYAQVANSKANKIQGSGIGLSLVKILVELHEGSVSLVSEPGKGSEFTIELPARRLKEGEYEIAAEGVNTNNIDRINIEFSDIYSS